MQLQPNFLDDSVNTRFGEGGINVPRFGIGSRSCAGRENRTVAISVTPMNLNEYTRSDIVIVPHELQGISTFLKL